MNERIPILDLDKELLIRIDGEATKKHSVSWDVLRSVGDKLQMLIQTLATYSLVDNEVVDLNNFKIEFTGFYHGSAIPGWAYNKNPIPTLFNVESKLKKIVNEQFSRTMYYVDMGNYQAIADNYNTEIGKNDVITKVYEFSNAAGTSPIEIVRKNKNKDHKDQFQKVYNIRKINKETLDKLIIKNYEPLLIDNAIEQSAVGKIIVRNTKSGRISKKAIEVYSEKEAVLSVSFNKIKSVEREYILTHEILFRFAEEGKGIVIENEQLDLVAGGSTLVNAEINLFELFDHTHQRLNQLPDDQLSERLINVKKYYNFIVKSVKNV